MRTLEADKTVRGAIQRGEQAVCKQDFTTLKEIIERTEVDEVSQDTRDEWESFVSAVKGYVSCLL